MYKSEKQFKNTTKHLKDNGLIPMIHGNTGKIPKCTYPFEVTYEAIQFIKNFTDIHGLPQPSARRGRADIRTSNIHCIYQYLITTK